MNAGAGHMAMYNTNHTKNLTVVVSVYDAVKPANMVLEELMEWAEINDPTLAERIEEMSLDMTWNDGHSV